METTAVTDNAENSTAASSNAVVEQNHIDNSVSDIQNHGDVATRNDSAYGDVRGILELIAATGKFWHDWERLKGMLSSYLKRVLSEYAEASMTTEQQSSSLGETFQELVERLNDALYDFIEGPPFTLQRLCEILLAARSIYPKLSKLALALEKNLLVTSTLTICTDPYPLENLEKPNGVEKEPESPQPQLELIQNGVEPTVGDRDEIMTEVEEADVGDEMTMDMETFEEIVRSAESETVNSAEANSMPTSDS